MIGLRNQALSGRTRTMKTWNELTPEQQQQIDAHLFGGRHIEAIKLYRQWTHVGLKEGKDALDARDKELRQQSPQSFSSKPSGCFGMVLLAVGGLAAAVLLLGGVALAGRSEATRPCEVVPTTKPDGRAIQGTWELLSCVSGGKPDPDRRRMVVVIDANEARFVDGETVFRRATYRVDASKSPPWIDLFDAGAPASLVSCIRNTRH
jgi:uncharacterized protein (TIGR03067 family)